MRVTAQQRNVERRASMPAARLQLAPSVGIVSVLLLIAGVVTGTLVLLMHAESFLGALYHEQLSPAAARSLFLSLVVAMWLLIPPFGSPAGTDWVPPAWSGLAALGAIVTAIVLSVRSRREA